MQTYEPPSDTRMSRSRQAAKIKVPHAGIIHGQICRAKLGKAGCQDPANFSTMTELVDVAIRSHERQAREARARSNACRRIMWRNQIAHPRGALPRPQARRAPRRVGHRVVQRVTTSSSSDDPAAGEPGDAGQHIAIERCASRGEAVNAL